MATARNHRKWFVVDSFVSLRASYAEANSEKGGRSYVPLTDSHRPTIDLRLLLSFILATAPTTMPWQSLSSLVVVITMFNVAPLLVSGIQYVGYGVSLLGAEFDGMTGPADRCSSPILSVMTVSLSSCHSF